METLVVVTQHRNQYHGRVDPHGPARFGSSPSKHFGEFNCRTFQSGTGILPTPFKGSTTSVNKHTPSFSSSSSCSSFSSSSPKTPSSTIKEQSNTQSIDDTRYKLTSKSSPIPINIKVPKKVTPFNEDINLSTDNVPFYELWAGPTYSNSPPPSSLPIPKFSMRPKRTVSLELPDSESGIKLQPVAKSAPASPTREHSPPSRDLFLSVDFATKTLRRILNLDVVDD